MRGKINNAGLHAPGGQILRHLQADKPAASHNRALNLPRFHRRAKRHSVLRCAHNKYVFQVQSRNLRHKGRSSRGDDQLVVAILLHLAASQVPRLHLVFRRPHRDGLHLGQHLRPGKLGKLFRRVDNQLALLVNNVPHIVGKTASGVGNVPALGKDCYLAAAVRPFELRRHLGSRRHAA